MTDKYITIIQKKIIMKLLFDDKNLPYSLWSPQMWYNLRLPKILLQQTGAEGLYYKTKREQC